MAKNKFKTRNEIKSSNALGKTNKEFVDKITKYKDSADDETKKNIDEATKNPNTNNLMKVTQSVKQDKNLSKKSKREILKEIQKYITTEFNFDYLPEDYNTLKNEAKFFCNLAKSSFVLMAHRLKKIRDDELYKLDNYNTFEEFFNAEIPLKKTTIYYYIDVVTYFEVPARGLSEDFPYSKLKAVLPLLKSKKKNVPKDEIKKQFIEKINDKSYRELEQDAKKLKVKYGIIKKPETKRETELVMNYVKTRLNPEKVKDEMAKNDVKKLIEYLKSLIL